MAANAARAAAPYGNAYGVQPGPHPSARAAAAAAAATPAGGGHPHAAAGHFAGYGATAMHHVHQFQQGGAGAGGFLGIPGGGGNAAGAAAPAVAVAQAQAKAKKPNGLRRGKWTSEVNTRVVGGGGGRGEGGSTRSLFVCLLSAPYSRCVRDFIGGKKKYVAKCFQRGWHEWPTAACENTTALSLLKIYEVLNICPSSGER